MYPWSLHSLLNARPSLGELQALCEENYRLLERLIPEMQDIYGYHRSEPYMGLDLHLEVLEQTPYTTLLHLTYYFGHEHGVVRPDPDTTIRAYHDAGQVEVIDLEQMALPLPRGPHFPNLQQKWRVNLFLSKWLNFCVTQGHRIDAGTAGAQTSITASA